MKILLVFSVINLLYYKYKVLRYHFIEIPLLCPKQNVQLMPQVMIKKHSTY